MTPIRIARTGDAEAITRIQIASWRAAYRSIMPAEFLATLDEAERADRWRGRIGPAAPAEAPIFVAVDDADAVLGFVSVGPVRDDDVAPAGRGEVYTLYVDPGAWRRGIGSALLAAADEHWPPPDVRELLLWVFEDNAAARAFYEAQGWAADGTRRIDDFGSAQPAEIRYRRRLVTRKSRHSNLATGTQPDRPARRPHRSGVRPRERGPLVQEARQSTKTCVPVRVLLSNSRRTGRAQPR